jgi:hypothetical protein
MEKKETNQVLAGVLGKVEGIRADLEGYGAGLEGSTVEAEQTEAYRTATAALNSFESAVKALAFDEVKRG